MSGKKGQRWNTQREPRKIKVNTALSIDTYNQILNLCKKENKKISAKIREIVEIYIEKH